MAPAIAILCLFALLALAVPVAFAMALVGMGGLLDFGGTRFLEGFMSTAPMSVASSYEFLTLPMFLLMAEFVLVSGVASALFDTAAAWTSRVRGGLGMATTLAGAGFGAICGTSTAAAATLSSAALPQMIRQGYRQDLASGVVAISGTLSILIPPSVALIVYGIIADVGIGDLLIASLIPALLVTLGIMVTVAIIATLNPEAAPQAETLPLRQRLRLLWSVFPVLILFGFVTGSIYLGIATPTEASALGALGAFLLAVARGAMTWAAATAALQKAVFGTCMILMIILGATIFGYFFTLTQITQSLVGFIGGLDVAPWVVIAGILAMYLVLGWFMDQTAILILSVPISVPVVTSVGYDPVWFGIVVVVAAEIGMVTPPVGLNAFIVSRYSGIPLAQVFRGVLPFVVSSLLVLILLAAFPGLALWLPAQM